MVDLNKPGSIKRTIAMAEIQKILHRYCIMAHENAPFDEIQHLFHPHGFFRLPDGTAFSPADMGKVVRGQPPSMISPHISRTNIHFTGGRRATAKLLFFAMTGLSAINYQGYQMDEFELGPNAEDGGVCAWLLAKRSIIIEGQEPKGCYAMSYGV
ncbi:hypothetical protein BJX65DRAFT_313734 [Aspergillus insuetus]